MNSIKIYLLSTLFLVFFNNLLFSQNDFYNDKKEEKNISSNKVTINDIDLIDEYTTEKDYNEIHHINKIQYNDDELLEEEIYSNQKNTKTKKDTIAAEVVADVILNVFVNAVFIIATCWH
ncbi:MAG: hypothetical protein COX70_03100 [Flavobacteriales bacterium CG_4_10_14_0_2_um_filter_32_8]|nr:MAG: hypothetical protein COX70_03100 [Flavobacteriales bacterium CG_4_10_14_0_2_um_filter_32_8]PJB16597.1 MAG: hypothetical protein CO118_00165 [Flavobacteriales bacterium CG_4_9_14_3_um_filter_32_8]